MILVDSKVPMYLVGDAHPHKADVKRIMTFDAGFDSLPGIERVR